MYLFNISALDVQVATTIMTGIMKTSYKLSRVVRTRKLWELVVSKQAAQEQSRVTLLHPFNHHVHFLDELLEYASIFIAFGTALLIRLRYNEPLPIDVVVSSFFVQLAFETYFTVLDMLFESSLQGFSGRAAAYLEHQSRYSYLYAGLKSLIILPLMSALWVSVIVVVQN